MCSLLRSECGILSPWRLWGTEKSHQCNKLLWFVQWTWSKCEINPTHLNLSHGCKQGRFILVFCWLRAHWCHGLSAVIWLCITVIKTVTPVALTCHQEFSLKVQNTNIPAESDCPRVIIKFQMCFYGGIIKVQICFMFGYSPVQDVDGASFCKSQEIPAAFRSLLLMQTTFEMQNIWKSLLNIRLDLATSLWHYWINKHFARQCHKSVWRNNWLLFWGTA